MNQKEKLTESTILALKEGYSDKIGGGNVSDFISEMKEIKLILEEKSANAVSHLSERVIGQLTDYLIDMLTDIEADKGVEILNKIDN